VLPFFDLLAERYKILVPEHPGFGGSDDPPWIRSMADLAFFYLDLLEETGLDLPWYLSATPTSALCLPDLIPCSTL
jgi:pimeloyl-ACP methyl ester carboxylesterase